MIDPTYIKIAALAGGALLLFWPLIPKAVEGLKGLVKSEPALKSDPDLIDATTALSLVKTYLDRDDSHPDIDDAIETLAVAVVKKGL